MSHYIDAVDFVNSVVPYIIETKDVGIFQCNGIPIEISVFLKVLEKCQKVGVEKINLNSDGINTHAFCSDCTICTESFKHGESVKQLSCKHSFHPNCIDEWFIRQPNCPTCRVELHKNIKS
jgi:hypothetical protein